VCTITPPGHPPHFDHPVGSRADRSTERSDNSAIGAHHSRQKCARELGGRGQGPAMAAAVYLLIYLLLRGL
jgi:hypothetical protein